MHFSVNFGERGVQNHLEGETHPTGPCADITLQSPAAKVINRFKINPHNSFSLPIVHHIVENFPMVEVFMDRSAAAKLRIMNSMATCMCALLYLLL